MKTGAVLVAACLAATACAPRHVQPFTPRERVYAAGKYAQAEASAKPTVGSLYSDATPGFLEDTRAKRVGDTVKASVGPEKVLATSPRLLGLGWLAASSAFF